MKFIIINDYYTAGGCEVQSKRELELFSQKGHIVKYITIDPKLKYHESCQPNHLNLAYHWSQKERFICNKRLCNEIKSIIKDFSPDFIHLENIYLSAPAVYQAIKGNFCLQTIRDFSIVCVKSTCIKKDCSICSGINFENCIRNCMPLKIKDFIIFWGRYIALKLNNHYRKLSVNKFISPSKCLTYYCNNHGYNTICINNPFDNAILKNFKKIYAPSQKKIFLYYGVVSERKGVLRIIEAFHIFLSKGNNAELHIIGKLDRIREKDLNCSESIKYFSFMPYPEIIKKLQSVYSVIVPSIWLENYPNTVLEGFATECIVLGSNRGGIPEQIETQECIFDVLNTKDIVRALEFAFSLNDEERFLILEKQKDYLRKHNTQDVYYRKVINILKENGIYG